MNKLTKIFFGPRPVSRDPVTAHPVDQHISVRRRERLISVWIPDPETGRLVCTWHKT